jgi:hypothetical protein
LVYLAADAGILRPANSEKGLAMSLLSVVFLQSHYSTCCSTSSKLCLA